LTLRTAGPDGYSAWCGTSPLEERPRQGVDRGGLVCESDPGMKLQAARPFKFQDWRSKTAFQDWRSQTSLAPKSTPAQWLGSLELGPGLASCGRHARCALGALSLSWFAFQRLSDEDFAVVGGNLQAVPTLSLTRESPVKWKIDSWRTPPLSVTAIFIAPPSGSERNSSTESFL